ncbi:MAG: DUF3021 domain-containing protein [Oscillospiraceae bacterium]|nr:DUF3021 domain-containing protein [Oscillospiraceae bacterium]
MKKNVQEFFRRGLVACGFGPLVLAVLYLILQRSTGLEQLSVNEVCRAIFSISALAFVAGGMNVLYQIERLPLMWAILIHGVVLYFAYLATYQINHWLQTGMKPLVIFTVIFVLGYLAVWAIIYSVTKKNTEKLNEALKEKQQN